MIFKVFIECFARHMDNISITLVVPGNEFQAVFLSTTEPICEDGNTRNPTKSPCDRYVFNTVLTRAKSLVVVVGSPLILLNTEAHMVKLYGEKGKCWSLYLKSCLKNGTLLIPPLVEPDQSISVTFKRELAKALGVTLPNDIGQQSSRPNYQLTCFSKTTATTSLPTSGLNVEANQPICSRTEVRLVNKPLSSHVVTQQTFPADNSSSTDMSYSQSIVEQKLPAESDYPKRTTIAQQKQGVRVVDRALCTKPAVQRTVQLYSKQNADTTFSQLNTKQKSTIPSHKQNTETETQNQCSIGGNYYCMHTIN